MSRGLVYVSVSFDAIDNERKPGEQKAINVRGGVCFDHAFGQNCRGKANGRCKFSHADRPMAIRKEPSLEEAVAAVVASRAGAAAPVLVDTVEACRAQCERLVASGVVAVDFEGVNLCRDGELLLAQLAASEGPVVLIDVLTLGERAFADGGLRALLESAEVLKLVFDGRSDSDALFHLHSCKLTHVCDCQVLCALNIDEERSRRGQERLAKLPGLGSALSSCPSLAASGDGKHLAQLKKAVQPLFVPEVGPRKLSSTMPTFAPARHTSILRPLCTDRRDSMRVDCQLGGSYENWRTRPLSHALLEYAAADVAHLHKIYAEWGHLISAEGMEQITAARIEKATSGDGRAKGPHMADRDF
jgi:hypothetical protein